MSVPTPSVVPMVAPAATLRAPESTIPAPTVRLFVIPTDPVVLILPSIVVELRVPGIMLAVSAQNDGIADPDVQLPNTWLADCDKNVPVSVPDDVTGDPEIENIDDGSDRPTLLTVPVPLRNIR